MRYINGRDEPDAKHQLAAIMRKVSKNPMMFPTPKHDILEGCALINGMGIIVDDPKEFHRIFFKRSGHNFLSPELDKDNDDDSNEAKTPKVSGLAVDELRDHLDGPHSVKCDTCEVNFDATTTMKHHKKEEHSDDDDINVEQAKVI